VSPLASDIDLLVMGLEPCRLPLRAEAIPLLMGSRFP
jgi:hypothetical protein